MKKIAAILIFFCGTLLYSQKAHAQLFILEIIKAAIKKVIVAVDLEIQREQNKVIWLQDAQKTLENTMSKLKLNDISQWAQKQKDLYANYFDELQKVKTIISLYERVKDITTKEQQLIKNYNTAWATVQSDHHFTASEIQYMGSVYSGIITETASNVEQLTMVISSFKTQMSDQKRLEIINAVDKKVDGNCTDLARFTQQNALLSLQRAHDSNEIATVKKMYGIQ
ncbi:conjugal transfer protein TraI [Mucilaginibacter sp. SMC90]|uniref:conjugal transfer protein TraI n=1 Tax=Mucilaginibacter sp. SMC90 TaxID=2929803 RepID=UPI001FB3FF62|nr:conjugal transfer protein TraI [Mucilaginibacter sp. SMC90]UOE51350.1 conjugal transfer protein TraI [Mucilaginibacter sp. SMC90]